MCPLTHPTCFKCEEVSVAICWKKGREKLAWTWSGCGCVEDVLPRPLQEMRLAVAWAAFLNVCAVCPCRFCVLIIEGFRWLGALGEGMQPTVLFPHGVSHIACDICPIPSASLGVAGGHR